MTTIAQKLTELNDIKQNIKSAIDTKGGDSSGAFDTYAAAILALPSPPASGGIVYGKSDVVTITPYDATVKTIGDRDFQSWTHATGLVINSGFETIQEYAFYRWTNATTLTLPSTLKTIAQYAFEGWSSLQAINLPSGLQSIGQYAFQNCTAATGVLTIPASVTSFNNGNFQGCSNVTEVIILSSAATLSPSLFNGMTSCKKFDIPSTVTAINTNAFLNATSCEEMIFRSTTPPTLATTSLSGLNAACVIKVPAGSVDAYKAATNWSAHASKIVAI